MTGVSYSLDTSKRHNLDDDAPTSYLTIAADVLANEVALAVWEPSIGFQTRRLAFWLSPDDADKFADELRAEATRAREAS